VLLLTFLTTIRAIYYFSHDFSGEQGAVMQPYMIELYIKALHEKREREAEYERLVALANRSRRQRRLADRPRWLIRFLHPRQTRTHDETPWKPTLDMNRHR